MLVTSMEGKLYFGLNTKCKLLTGIKEYRFVLEFEKAKDEGKIASFISVEGGHSIQSSLSVLRQYYDLGVRILTLTHTCSTPWYKFCLINVSCKMLLIEVNII
jgi:microsomal dipeptidase-like Zn-dependent dipeptidase